MSRWWLLISTVAFLLMLPFLIWGEWLSHLSFTGMAQWLGGQGGWAWALAIGLLCADILLPIPGTVVMSALGYIYGWWLGGIIASAGSFLSGLIAYGACRAAGRPAARWIAGDESLAKGEKWFAGSSAGWVVAVSRWTPVLPETIACLAGLALMPARRFIAALACGTVPLGFAFAAIGQIGTQNGTLAVVLSAALPLALYGVAARFIKR